MNFQELQGNVLYNLANQTGLTDRIKSWINSSYLNLVTAGKFPEAGLFAPIPVDALDETDTFATEADKADYLLPAAALFIVSLRDTTSGFALKQKSIRRYDRNQSTSPGPPARYARYSRTIYIDPTPDAAYTIRRRFRKKVAVPALTLPTDTPVIGAEWHEAIELDATYKGARALGYPDAAKWRADLKTFVIEHSEQGTEEEEDANIGFSIVW